jgi:hypothetical protein
MEETIIAKDQYRSLTTCKLIKARGRKVAGCPNDFYSLWRSIPLPAGELDQRFESLSEKINLRETVSSVPGSHERELKLDTASAVSQCQHVVTALVLAIVTGLHSHYV